MEFEWDIVNAATNLAKHGISFELAQTVFQDHFAVERQDVDPVSGEVRWNLIGLAFGRELFVTYTVRNGKIRLMSARKAQRDEREQYWTNR